MAPAVSPVTVSVQKLSKRNSKFTASPVSSYHPWKSNEPGA